MVQSPNPRRLVIFGGRIKTSQRPTVEVAAKEEFIDPRTHSIAIEAGKIWRIYLV